MNFTFRDYWGVSFCRKSNMSKNVFILSKNPIASRKLEEQIKELGYESESHVGLSSLQEAVGIESAMVVIIDKMAGDDEAEVWVSELRMKFPRHCLLLMISNSENHLLKNYVKAGVTDVLQKPLHPVALSLRLKVHQPKALSSLPTQNEMIVGSEDDDSIKHVS